MTDHTPFLAGGVDYVSVDSGETDVVCLAHQDIAGRRKSLSDVFGDEMATEVWDRFTVH